MHTYTYEIHLEGPGGEEFVTMTQITTNLVDAVVQKARDHDMMAHLQGTMPSLGYKLLSIQKLETMGSDLPPNIVEQDSPWHRNQPHDSPVARHRQASTRPSLRLVGKAPQGPGGIVRFPWALALLFLVLFF